MSSPRTLLLTCALALLLLMASLHIAGFSIGASSGHLLSSQCDSCHLARGEITALNAGSLLDSQEILCADCHEREMRVSHPSGVPGNSGIPEQFPLDWKGDLTCSSCHDIHSSRAGLPRTRVTGKSYCLMCHQESFFAAMTDGGISLVTSTHVASTDPGIDDYSINCIDCHSESGSLGGQVAVAGSLVRHSSGSGNHPIAVSYDQASSYGGYRQVSLIDDKVMLPDGLVSCVSCHEGYSQVHGRLVLPRGDLCFECHDL